MNVTNIIFSILVLSGSAHAASVQCRGVDGEQEQIAVRVSDIQVNQERTPVGGSLQIITLKGRDMACSEVGFIGDRKDQMKVLCYDQQGEISLNLKIKSENKYEGVFCGHGENTRLGKLQFAESPCLKLYCQAKDLSN